MHDEDLGFDLFVYDYIRLIYSFLLFGFFRTQGFNIKFNININLTSNTVNMLSDYERSLG